MGVSAQQSGEFLTVVFRVTDPDAFYSYSRPLYDAFAGTRTIPGARITAIFDEDEFANKLELEQVAKLSVIQKAGT